VDCNAIAPRTVRTIGETITAAGGQFADVGIIGPPPTRPGTKFYASGPGASALAELRNYGLDVRVLDGEIGQASGLKMCYGAMTKGLTALGTELLVAARLMGLEEALRAEQRETMAEVLGWVERSMPTMPPKAYRWVGEMEEIGTCFEDLGMTPAILNGAAEMYRFVAETPIGKESPENRDRSRDAAGVIAALADALAAEPVRQG
jgi:3-hydroxyisobutyrate dehydrogenase-like beta-hydroxyacid dehydrogenase